MSDENGEDLEDSFPDGSWERRRRVSLEELSDGEEDVGRQRRSERLSGVGETGEDEVDMMEGSERLRQRLRSERRAGEEGGAQRFELTRRKKQRALVSEVVEKVRTGNQTVKTKKKTNGSEGLLLELILGGGKES